MYILAFSGKLKSGKGTVTNHLKKVTGGKVYSFAHNLREFIIQYLGVPRELAYTSDKDQLSHLCWKDMPHWEEIKKRYNPPLSDEEAEIVGNGFMMVRSVLEEVGTQVMRRMRDKVWCEELNKEMKNDWGAYHLMMVDDLRFMNEAEYLKEEWGSFVKLIRLTRTTTEAAANQHVSNVALDGYEGWDAVIDNQNLSVAQTLEAVEKLCEGWGIDRWVNKL